MKPTIKIGTYGRFPFKRTFNLHEKLLKTHKHVLGITGQGKSKLLAHMTASFILQGVGCCLLDPHADLANDVLQILADNGFFTDMQSASKKLMYVEFKDTERYIPFNFLFQPNYDMYIIARNMVEVCQRVWPSLSEGAAPTLENVIYFSTLVLVQNKLSLSSLSKLIANKQYRESLLANCTDPMIADFWREQYEPWEKKDPTIPASSLRRANLLTVAPPLRNTIGQQENVLMFRKLLDTNTSVIVNLGGLDENTQRILGCLITKGFEQAAEARENIPEHQRSLYNLILDEFSMFSAQSEEALTRVLSLCRKYNLFLTLAHQNFSQLSERIQGALQNAMPIYFRLGYDDAVWAAPRIGRADPYHAKHEVKEIKEGGLRIEPHPAYYPWQEQEILRAQKLEHQWAREIYVKIKRKPNYPIMEKLFHPYKEMHLRTIDVPKQTCTNEDLQKVKDFYASWLMQPREKAPAITTQAMISAPKRPRRI